MKTTILLLLSAALAIPASAQSSSNPPANAGASAAQATSDREPLTPPKSQNFWDGDEPNVVNLVVHPFATKAYVQRQVAPIRDRVNELEEISGENSNKIKDIDARAQQGVRMASEKASQADQHALEAANRAELAKTAATDANTRVASAEKMVDGLNHFQGGAQTEIRFRSGQTTLSQKAKSALDDMALPLKAQKGYAIEVRGYAPGHGRTATANSGKMAGSVVRYLVQTHQIPVYRIHVLNMGNAGLKRGSGGRVEISVLKNDMVASAQ